MVIKNKQSFVKEVFENFGYIEIEACEPSALKKYLSDNFITMRSTKDVGACEEFRFTGTYSSLRNMLKEFWGEEYTMKEFFKRIK